MKNKFLQLLICLSLSISAAEAQSKKEIEEAKKLFDSATVYYNKKEYEKALVGYQDAYKVAQLPFILFNIAQCYRFLDRHQEAKDAYEKYLRDEPKSEYRAEVEQKIKDLDAKIAEEKHLTEEKRLIEEARLAEEKRLAEIAASQATSTAATTPATQPAKSSPEKNKFAYWALPGSTAAGSLVLGGISLAMNQDANDPTLGAEKQSLAFDRGRITAPLSDALAAATIGLIVYKLVTINKTKETTTKSNP